MQGSPLAHMRNVFLNIIKACNSQVGHQSPSQVLASRPPLLRPLHTLITACLEIPTAALSATSLDVALYETLADALAPACGRTSAEEEQQRAGDGSVPIRPIAVPGRDGEQLQQQLLQLVLGTYVRRYLCRQASWHLRMHVQTHAADANGMHVADAGDNDVTNLRNACIVLQPPYCQKSHTVCCACCRSSFGHVVHQRPAVNAVRFLEMLFTQPSLRGDEGSLRALLPPLLGPMLEAFCPVE